MKQIIQSYKTGKVTLENVPVPRCSKKYILVRNCHSLISIGTEKSTIALGKKSLLGKACARPDLLKRVIEKAKNEGLRKTFTEAMGRLDTPTPLGYSAAGVVIETGSEARGFAKDDRVACIGQGFASHAEYIAIPVNLAVKLPDSVSTESAAFGMLGCIALHGIRCADLTFGSKVAVIGLGLLGQLTTQLLKAYGCEVFAYDLLSEKTALAEQGGAAFSETDAPIFKDKVAAQTQNVGVDAVIVTAATSSSEPVNFAVDLCRTKAKIVVVGVADIHPNRNALWLKEIELIVSKAAGPGSLLDQYERQGIDYPIAVARWTENRNLAEFIRLLDKNLIDLSLLVTQKYAFEKAQEIYDAFLKNKLDNPIGVLFEYSDAPNITRHIRLPAKQNRKNNVTVSVIGAGLYGKAIFLPVLKKSKNITLKTLVTSSGMSAQHNAKRFGFTSCATDSDTALQDDETDALIVLTPHSQHADLILKSIQHKKALLIEKPLCINQKQLLDIITAYNQQTEPSILMVGHNRRYSPHVKTMQNWLKNRINPAVFSIRVNAGFVPAEHWVHSDSEGRSRIVGEMTHFIDLMQCLLRENPTSVFAQRASGDDQSMVNNDNIVVSFKFNGGSVASLVYTAMGNRSLNREYIEIFFDNKTIVSRDFRYSELIAGKQSEKFKTSGQALGYSEEIKAFIEHTTGKTDDRSVVPDNFIAMQSVFAIEQSLAQNKTIAI